MKGISLFLVPKHKVSDAGAISKDFNGVNIGRIEVRASAALLCPAPLPSHTHTPE